MLTPYARRDVAKYYGPNYRTAGAVAGMSAFIPYAYRVARYGYNRYANYKSKPTVKQLQTAKKSINKSIIRKKKKSFPKTVKKQISHLRKLAESDMGTLIYRDLISDRLLASTVNQQVVSETSFNTKTDLEAVLAQLRYYDPTAPTTLVTADGATGTYQKEFLIQHSSGSMKFINNYQTPCLLKVYLCKNKVDTNILPATAFTNGLADVSSMANTNLQAYPNDSEQLKDLYSVKLLKKVQLQPGRSCSVSQTIKDFQYDPTLYDSHALDYQKAFKSYHFMYILSGVLGHDSVLDEQGFTKAGIDIQIHKTYKVKYAAGADIKYVYTTQTLATFTNGALVTNNPITDNQGFNGA